MRNVLLESGGSFRECKYNGEKREVSKYIEYEEWAEEEEDVERVEYDLNHVQPKRNRILSSGGSVQVAACMFHIESDIFVSLSIQKDLKLPSVHLNISLKVEKKWTDDDDCKILTRNLDLLKASNWYHGSISWDVSAKLLNGTKQGTFLLRDSSDARFLYTLSVQTLRGPTSIRIAYHAGKFKLDGSEREGRPLPKFDNVIELVQFYMENGGKKGQVWLDSAGRLYSPASLSEPRRAGVGSLQHAARIAFNREKQTLENLPPPLIPPPVSEERLPPFIQTFLDDYTYPV